MKRYRDPSPALRRPEPDLPLTEKIFCWLIVGIIVAAAVWISVNLRLQG